MPNSKLISIEDIHDISQQEIRNFYERYLNPGMLWFQDKLGFTSIEPDTSEGCYILTKDGRRILDFTGGRGVLGLGHNHPRLAKVRTEFEQENRPIVWKDFLSPYMAVLAHNLAQLCPGDLNYCFFCNSGAEANEGALKLAEKLQGRRRDKVLATTPSYHGKTHATLALSSMDESRKYFREMPGTLFVPFGDAAAARQAILERGGKEHDICALILEPIQAGSLNIPNVDYLQKLRKITEEFGVILIIDEVYTGLGKTGKMFAFEHSEIIPDIITMSKTLGGGKATIGAYVARDETFLRAYGQAKDALIHTSTFNGFSNECVTAIESLALIVAEDLPGRAKNIEAYMMRKLEPLRQKYGHLVKDVRAIGGMCGIEFRSGFQRAAALAGGKNSLAAKLSNKVVALVMISQLLEKHDVLTFVYPEFPAILHLEPPLIAAEADLDRGIAAIEDILERGLLKQAASRLIQMARSR